MEQKFYKCAHCGKIIAVVKETGVPVMCCGQKMDELVPNTTDAAQEKHVPVVEVSGNIVTVTVGSVLHPMQPEHYIEWISLHTKQGNQGMLPKPCSPWWMGMKWNPLTLTATSMGCGKSEFGC